MEGPKEKESMGKLLKKLFGKTKKIDPNFSVCPTNFVDISSKKIDSEENIPTPNFAIISYLDASALKFWNGKRTDYIVPTYYNDTAFGRNVLPARDRLLARGFLSIGDLRRNISLKTVPELKAVLAERELKTSGKKAELVQRLLDYVPEEDLEDLFPVGEYCVTDTGKKAMEPYSIIQVNNDHGLHFSYYRLLKEKEKTPTDSNNVILTRLLSQDIQMCYRTGNISEYYKLLSEAERFMREIGEAEQALECSILAYFIWLRNMDKLHLSPIGQEGFYMAHNIEVDARNAGFNLSKLLEMFRETVVKYHHPFGIGSENEIQTAIDTFKAALQL